MAELTLNKRKIDDAVKVATMSVAQQVGALSPAEALIAFSEVVGRVIVAQQGTPILHQDMKRLAFQRIEDTIRAGYIASGKSGDGLDA